MPNALLGANTIRMSERATHYSSHLFAGNIVDKLSWTNWSLSIAQENGSKTSKNLSDCSSSRLSKLNISTRQLCQKFARCWLFVSQQFWAVLLLNRFRPLPSLKIFPQIWLDGTTEKTTLQNSKENQSWQQVATPGVDQEGYGLWPGKGPVLIHTHH